MRISVIQEAPVLEMIGSFYFGYIDCIRKDKSLSRNNLKKDINLFALKTRWLS